MSMFKPVREYSVVVPVGPDPEELLRLADLRASLLRHGERPNKTILVDDAQRPRPLASIWPGAVVIRTGSWDTGRPDPHSAMVAGSIEAFKLAEGEFTVKLDTDALVIAPFAEKIAERLRLDPSIGIAGAYDRTPNGESRDFSHWPGRLRSTRLPARVQQTRQRRLPLHWRRESERAVARRVLAAARTNRRYELGAHCLGAAYAVSCQLLAFAHDWDWRPWVKSGLSEDVVMGLLCGAAGLRMEGMVDAGEPFGVSWRGLPGAPEELIERGYSIVHSVKDGPYGTEHELRARFTELQRQTASPGCA